MISFTPCKTFDMPATPPAAGENRKSLALADLNGDGTLDLLNAEMISPLIHLHPGRGDGTFAQPTALDTRLHRGVYAFKLIDTNRDGVLDVVALSADSPQSSVLFGQRK